MPAVGLFLFKIVTIELAGLNLAQETICKPLKVVSAELSPPPSEFFAVLKEKKQRNQISDGCREKFRKIVLGILL